MFAVSVTWNGTNITGPVLIYSDELPVDPSATTIASPNGPGALICRSDDRARISWRYTDGENVRSEAFNDDTFQQIRTGEGVTPSVSQLLLNRVNTEVDNPNLNGVWHCRLNGARLDDYYYSRYDGQINVEIFSRGGGKVLSDELKNNRLIIPKR